MILKYNFHHFSESKSSLNAEVGVRGC